MEHSPDCEEIAYSKDRNFAKKCGADFVLKTGDLAEFLKKETGDGTFFLFGSYYVVFLKNERDVKSILRSIPDIEEEDMT